MNDVNDIDDTLNALLDALDDAEQQWNEQTLFSAGYLRPMIDLVFSTTPRNMDSFLTQLDAEILKHITAELSKDDAAAVMCLWKKIRNQCKTQFV